MSDGGDGFTLVTSKRKKKKRREPPAHLEHRSQGKGNYRGRQNRRGGGYHRNERRDERPRATTELTGRRKVAIPIGGSQYRAQHQTNRGLWSDQARPTAQPPRAAAVQEVEEQPAEPQPNPFEVIEADSFHEPVETYEEDPSPVILEPIAIENEEKEVPKSTIEFQGLNSPDNPEPADVIEQPETVVEPVPVVDEKKEESPVFAAATLVKDKKPSSPVGWSWMGSKPKDPPTLSDSTPSDPLKVGISSLDKEILNKTAIKPAEPAKMPEKDTTTRPIPQPAVQQQQQQPWYPNQHNPYMVNHMQAGNTMGYVVPGMVPMRPQQYVMPIMGASPGTMMQNPMAPGLVFNHPNAYPMAYQPMLVRGNQRIPGAGDPNNPANGSANQSTQQAQPATRSQNLLTYNAIPHNAVPVYSEYIQPTHRPKNDIRKTKKTFKPKYRQTQHPAVPWFKSWGEMFAYTDSLKKSPGRIITRFLTFRDLFTCFFVLNKEISETKRKLPLLENLGVSTFSMFNINMDLPSWNIYKHFGRDQDTVQQFFSEWSPLGLREVTVETSALDDENFVMLTTYLRQCPSISRLTIQCIEQEGVMSEVSHKNLLDLLKSIHCQHLVIQGPLRFKIDGGFLKLLQDRILELTVLSESFQWTPFLISSLPSRLSGLTICCPQVSWIALGDTLPSDLKRLYIRATSAPIRRITDVEAARLFQKLPHVQLDFSLLQQFVKPNPETFTAIQRLDLFFDRDARSFVDNLFSNLPLSLRHFSISYTGHAHNALEGWWKALSQHTVANLEILELKDFDGYGLEDTIKMFRSKKFANLKRVSFVTIALSPRKCEDRLKAALPPSCELSVKKSETQI